jgi:peptidoglycan-N-acetylglucosamine deacetylase
VARFPTQTILALALIFFWAGLSRAETAPIIVQGSPAARRVALTFDDGPSPYTRQIMARLNRHGARGTFFVLGKHAAQYPGIIRALLSHGHEVGHHSFSHIRFPQADRTAWPIELGRTQAELALLGAPDSGLFRPPYSHYNQDLLKFLGHLNKRLVLWSVDSGDWRGLSAPEITATVLHRVHNGAIVIFHDSDEYGRADRGSTAAALEIILPALKSRGYEMVTVSELLAPPGPGE